MWNIHVKFSLENETCTMYEQKKKKKGKGKKKVRFTLVYVCMVMGGRVGLVPIFIDGLRDFLLIA